MIIVQSEADNGSMSMRAVLLALLQLFLDPHFCTIEGMCILLEKEFLHHLYDFHFFFGLTVRLPMTAAERWTSVYLFLSFVSSLVRQQPWAFEFTEGFLITLADVMTFIPTFRKGL